MAEKHPVTAQELEMCAMPTIASQMPVRFENGTVWSELTANCKMCNKDLPGEDVHGRISRLTPQVALVEAVGICHNCKLITKYFYRLHDDKRITGPMNGKWRTWQPRESFRERAMRWWFAFK